MSHDASAMPTRERRSLTSAMLVDAAASSGRELRDVFGTFLTGVTVVTTWHEGLPRGLTANSFTSVSLDPPLVLVCIARHAPSCEAFLHARRFGVNILGEWQQQLSARFASPGANRFEALEFLPVPGGPPLFTDCITALDCERHDVVVAGDHIVLIGRVKAFASTGGSPLGYYRGSYVSFGVGLAALERHSSTAMVVAALIEVDGSVLLWRRPSHSFWELPSVPLHYGENHRKRLPELVSRLAVEADVSFLYSVYQERDPHMTLVFRGTASGPAPDTTLLDGILVKSFCEQDEPWHLVSGSSPGEVLKRYFRERREAKFGIYWDAHGEGGRVAVLEGPPRDWLPPNSSPATS